MSAGTQSTASASVRYGTDLGLPLVDEAAFRNVVGHFASGVTVITTANGDELFGTTVSAVSSLSTEPPMMLVCLNTSSVTHDAVAASGRYAINILTSEQGSLARTFARKGVDKFAGVAHTVTEHGLPVLTGALATIECVVAETATGGTHTIFLGRVVAAQAGEGKPLAYYRGTFGNLEDALETAAYEGTRAWILRRRTPLHQTVNIAEVAADLRLDQSLIRNALIRLATESLVTATPSGAFEPTPMTLELVDRLYGTRATIEAGVLETYLADASDAQIEAIVSLSKQVPALDPADPDSLDDYLDVNLETHSAIVELAGSRQLVSSFRALNVSPVWRETYRPDDWRERSGEDYLMRLIDAIRRRDTASAVAIVHEQVQHFQRGAKDVIERSGGSA